MTAKNVEELEAAQKMVWISLQKIFCYMDKIKDARKTGMNPTAADITSCTSLQPPTTELDISYPTPEPETYCDQTTVQYQPGDSQWAADEYHQAPFNSDRLHQTPPYPLGDWQRGMEDVVPCAR